MTPEVRELVDRRWVEYGISLGPPGTQRQDAAEFRDASVNCYVVDGWTESAIES